jgi:hypothetical protein
MGGFGMRIELRLNNCRGEMECGLCGVDFPLGDIVAVAYDRHGEIVGNVCEECLKLSQEQIGKMLMFQVEKLRSEASILKLQAEAYQALAAEEITMPAAVERQRLEGLIQR